MDLRTQFRSAKKVHLHEKYRHRMPFPNDIALIFVDEPFQLTKTFGPMKISNADPVDNEPCHVGNNCETIRNSCIPLKVYFFYFFSWLGTH